MKISEDVKIAPLNIHQFLSSKDIREILRNNWGIKIPKDPSSLRDVGEIIRKVIEILWQTHEIVELDFGGETIASGSLFDEIAKLFNEFPKEEVKRRLRFVNIDPWDERLIVHLARLRLNKQKEAVKLEYPR